MKFIFFIVILFTSSAFALAQEKIKTEPQYPKRNETATIILPVNEYRQTEISVTEMFISGAYGFNPASLTCEANFCKVVLQPNDSTNGYLLQFTSRDRTLTAPTDAIVNIYGNDKKTIKGSNIAIIQALGKMKFDNALNYTNDSLICAAFDTEFKDYPENKRKNVLFYLLKVASWKRSAGRQAVLKELDLLAKEKSLTVNEQSTLSHLYGLYGNKEKEEYFAQLVRNQKPNGSFTFASAEMKNLDDEYFNKKFALTNSFYVDPDLMVHTLVSQAILQENFEKAAAILSKKPEGLTPRSYYAAAIAFTTQRILAKEALDLAEFAYELAKEQHEHPVDDDMRRYSKFNRGASAEILGYVLARNGKYAEAISYIKEAESYKQRLTAPDIQPLYYLAMANSDKYKDLKNGIESLLQTAGQSNEDLLTAAKTVYQREHNSIDGFDQYLASIQKSYRTEISNDALSKVIDKPAPDFYLEDLEGSKVALSSLKGKTVVLDFWATWCGPCLASFPAMQKAIEKYADNPDVVFLFIDTRETATDYKRKVKDLLARKKLNFKVLFDEGEKVASAFKVEGIPNKFIIAPNGNIYFSTSGFSGDNALITELSSMIDYASRTGIK